VLVVIVTIMTMTGRAMCSVNSYCDNNWKGLCTLLADIVTITGRSICSVNRYCDNNGNNGEVYLQY